MRYDDIDKIKKNASNVLDEIEKDDFMHIFLKSFKYSLKRKNIFISILLTMLILVVALIRIGYSEDTVSKFLLLVESSNTIALVMFGAVIMGYTIFQALAQGATLKEFLLNNDSDKSQFHSYNLSFFNTTIVYLLIIVINYILIIILKTIPPDWHIIYFDNSINNFIATILIFIYTLFNIYAFLEIKSFIFNLYKCFSINAVANTIEFIKEESDE